MDHGSVNSADMFSKASNLFAATVAIVAAIAALLAVPVAIEAHGRESEDSWLLVVWIGASSAVAALCLLNAFVTTRSSAHLASNILVLGILLTAILLSDDRVVQIVSACLGVGPVIWLLNPQRIGKSAS